MNKRRHRRHAAMNEAYLPHLLGKHHISVYWMYSSSNQMEPLAWGGHW